jgi:predicted ATP-binding protein involved in virulence
MRIKKIEWRNFSSYGNRNQEIEFENEANLYQILGENGSGKCFFPDTKIRIKVSDGTLSKINLKK